MSLETDRLIDTGVLWDEGPASDLLFLSGILNESRL